MYTDEILCAKLTRIEELLEKIVVLVAQAPHMVAGAKRDDSNKSVLISTEQAAQMTAMSVNWFRQKRVTGGGPPYVKMGTRSVRYRLTDLQEWFDKNGVRHTAEL